jgi:hypothetical protein
MSPAIDAGHNAAPLSKVALPSQTQFTDAERFFARISRNKKDFYFCVDTDGNVVGGRQGFERMLILLQPKKRKSR